nr:B-cell receptor CD22-like [Cherax quadricarinatus]
MAYKLWHINYNIYIMMTGRGLAGTTHCFNITHSCSSDERYDGRESQEKDSVRAESLMSTSRGTATLTLARITLLHAGIYECRVEFFRSPTHTSLVNLTVVETPRNVEVLDRRSGPPKHGVLGPYQEGMMVIFTCLARDGWPLPNVTWWRGKKMLDGGWEVSGPSLVRNDLVVSRLSRDWHNDTLTCIASNTHLVPPISVSTIIHMYLLPTSVIISGPAVAREGEHLRLRCTSRGSRPSALLTWMMRDSPVPAEKENTVYGRVTSSTLLINVTREDNSAKVTCRAANPAMPGSPITNTTKLNVHYPPSVHASLGRSLQPGMLKEGDDVYFTCSVDANPPATSINWYHEGGSQVQNVTAGIIISGDSLVIQRAHRSRSGKYSCLATNTLATVASNPVTLRIRYAPECSTSPTTYFIYDRPIKVTCTVSSFPPVTAIQWQWNSSVEVLRTTAVIHYLDQATAYLHVYPKHEQEDRALSCWAINQMGIQQKPCAFSVKVAKMPLPLSSCGLANITASSLSLTCQRPHTPAFGTALYRAENINQVIMDCYSPNINQVIMDCYSPDINQVIMDCYSPDINQVIMDCYSPDINKVIMDCYSPDINQVIMDCYSPDINQVIMDCYSPDINQVIMDCL